MMTGQYRLKQHFLMVCFYDPLGISTVRENIQQWTSFTQHRISVLNLWPGDGRHLHIPSSVDLNAYDGVIIHATASYNPANLWSLDGDLDVKLEDYTGCKILMKQDEQFQTAEFVKYIGTKGIDIVLTCVPPQEIDYVYAEVKTADRVFVSCLTGYVSDFLRDEAHRFMAERTIDVGYRGSIQPLSFGRLGYEKRKIGDDFRRICAAHGLSCDISSRWEDRFLGLDWFCFLGSKRATLGAESGSNLFDFTGQVQRLCEHFAAQHPNADPLSDEYFQKAYHGFLERFEGNVKYAQVSPRHFEAAAVKTVQVMYEGDYSGIFLPWKHFIPLKKDLSNVTEVVAALKDDTLVREIAERCYEEIIQNPRHHYRSFVEQVDAAIEAAAPAAVPVGLPRSEVPPPVAQPRRTAFVMMAHEPIIDPRVEWVTRTLEEAGFDVYQIGTYRWNMVGEGPTAERVGNARWRVRVERTKHDFALSGMAGQADLAAIEDQFGLLYLDFIRRQSATDVLRLAGGYADTDEIERFRSLCDYFYNTNIALLQAARLIGEPDLIVACDLEALPAGVVAGRELGCPVVYDAHEFWPFSVPGMAAWECNFWSAVERYYARLSDHRLTVSDPLADQMSQYYGLSFESLPNAVPLSDGNVNLGKSNVRVHRDKVVFLFQGNFAEQRGLEKLIEAWPMTDEACVLYLRGPANAFKEKIISLAEATGLVGKRIFFPQAVAEGDLVLASTQADVGLIPYQALLAGYRYCCPNKLSQYMAAGLPIITNELDFVSATVEAAQCGQTVSFNDTSNLAQVISAFAADENLRSTYGRNARAYFENVFNWDKLSVKLAAKVLELVRERPARAGGFDLSWIGSEGPMRQSASIRGALPAATLSPAQVGEQTVSSAPSDTGRERELEAMLAKRESRERELEIVLADRESIIASLKTIQGIYRYGSRFLAKRLLPWASRE